MAGQIREASPRRRVAPAACVTVCAAFAFSGIASSDTGKSLLMGSIELHPCPKVKAFCGRFVRPLDPTGAVPGRIAIHFEFYPHSGTEKAESTLVATEGGPGYPATASRADYLSLFRPLRRRQDVLLMDNRGTGQSGAIDCHELQSAEKWTVELVAACGRSLGETAPLYSTAYAADDLAAVLEALNIRQIDLYGDSYGTYFEQVFAIRHPNFMRSVVLDGAYPLNGLDYAWYPSYAPAMRDKFDIACRRSPPCARLPRNSIERMQPVLEELRARPFPARAADSDGKLREFIADASKLAIVMYGSAPARATLREFDAAARAFIDADRPPLLRLMAETLSDVDSRDPTADPAQWSAGLAAAVMCHDPPQIFDMRLAPALRIADRDRAVAERKRAHPDTYAPFSIDEYRDMPLDYSFIDQCVEWPVPPTSHPASHVVAAEPHYPDIPALVIAGEFDNLTTMADGVAVAGAFQHGTLIRVANGLHVNALPRARSDCGAQIARRFIETLSAGDTACAANAPPLRLVHRFAMRASQLEPAVGIAGNRASTAQLRWSSAAAMTAGDVLARLEGNTTGQGVGLRGGSFRVDYAASSIHVTLTLVRWTEDLAVSGDIDGPAARAGTVRARLQLHAAEEFAGDLDIEWPEGAAASIAVIRGTLGGALVRARTPAP